MTDFEEGDRVLVQYEAVVTERFEDGGATVDVGGREVGTKPEEVIAVIQGGES